MALATALMLVLLGPGERGASAQSGGPAARQGGEAGKADLASAKRHYLDGHAKLQAGDVAGALADFRVANDIKATPQAERLIARCLDSLGQLREAAEWYAKFLAHVPEGMAGQAEKARARLAEIRAMPGKVHVESSPPGATVVVDGHADPVLVPADLELSPGPHVVTWTEAGRPPIEKKIEVAFASQQTIQAEFAKEAPVVAEPVPPPVSVPASVAPSGDQGIPSSVWVAGAVAVVAAGVGTAFGIAALDDKTEFDRHMTTQNANNRNVHALAADFSFGVAIVSGLATAFLFFGSRGGGSQAAPPPPSTAPPAGASGTAGFPREHTAAEWAVVPVFDAHGAGAGVVLHY
ncbi:MAG: hypothetical protein JOZ69_04105 [Myxococcales bacterium]|nr:hypothetical protein [Myxococcales bacterium]